MPEDDYETVTISIKMETKPGCDHSVIATAMVNAAEGMGGVLAAWEE